MNAVKLLKKQHRDVKKLFREAEAASSPERCRKLVEQISDQLAVHATIEEKIFYPGAMTEKSEDLLREAVEEHLGVKRIITDLLGDRPTDPQYPAKVTVLKEMIEHHVEEEEESLFPRTERALGDEVLEEMGSRMQAMAEELMSRGHPRDAVPSETKAPAPLPEPTTTSSKGRRQPNRELRSSR
jgi:hemerythrin-like domain-containing protein